MDIEKIFDIQGSPKTAEKLEKLQKHHDISKNVGVTILLIGGILFFIGILIMLTGVFSNITALSAIFRFIITLSGFVFMVIGIYLVTHSKFYLFQPITPEHASNVVALCQADPVIATYHNAVAAQRRSLVEGEYRAMEKWIKSKTQTEKDIKIKADSIENK